jgi:Fe2+ or Zn2+ uptake regulation protein
MPEHTVADLALFTEWVRNAREMTLEEFTQAFQDLPGLRRVKVMHILWHEHEVEIDMEDIYEEIQCALASLAAPSKG